MSETDTSKSQENEEEEYEVEEIIGKKVFSGGEMRFLVKWVGYSSKFNTWEPKENLVKCSQQI